MFGQNMMVGTAKKADTSDVPYYNGYEGWRVKINTEAETAGNTSVNFSGITPDIFASITPTLYVDWGDGENVEQTSSNLKPSHTYKKPGEYTVIFYSPDFEIVIVDFNNNTEITCVIDKLPKVSDASYFDGMFESCKHLETIPDGLFDNNKEKLYNVDFTFANTALTKIPSSLFEGCNNLTTASRTFGVINPSGCVVGDCVFANCPKLADIDGTFASEGITSIGSNTFANCTSLTTIEGSAFYSKKLEKIGSGTFKGCTALTKVQCFKNSSYDSSLPAITLGDGTFEGCTSLKSAASVFAYSNVSNTGANLFKGCTALTDVSKLFYGSGLKRIDADIFDGCTALTTLDQAFAVNEDVDNTDYNSQDITLTVADNMALSMKNFMTQYFLKTRSSGSKAWVVVKMTPATGATLTIDTSNEKLAFGTTELSYVDPTTDSTYSLSKDSTIYKKWVWSKKTIYEGLYTLMVCKNTATKSTFTRPNYAKYSIEFYKLE